MLMLKEMNRRNFLRATATTGAVVLTSNFLKASSWAEGVVNIPEAESITITVITDNLASTQERNYKIAKRLGRATSPLENALHGEHGLAYQIETVVGGQYHSCLFDFAADAQGVMRNMKLLKIDLTKVEALGLSHDHWDHQAALLEILTAKKNEFQKGIPLYVGEQFFQGTYSKLPNGSIISLLALKRDDIESLGLVRVVEVREPTAIIPGAYLPGKVERVTDYEQIPASFVMKKGNEFVQETFPGEQAVFLNAKGKGLVVLSGCAHRGIVNTVKQAQKMTGIQKVHAVIGGFHLSGVKPEVIEKTVAAIKAINPDYIAPTHCTGYEAAAAFKKEMPDRFILNTAGTKYIISSSII
jgi:7,8-dihydropterin-6-yl-methyl-4-(beta-D-ribofuranosyl)aminobenzene 5'-phosphate synthase